MHPQLEWHIRKNLENSLIPPALKTLWSLLLADRVKSTARQVDLYSWIAKFATSGLNTALRFELQSALKPVIQISEPYRFDQLVSGQYDLNRSERELKISELVEAEVVLSIDYPHSAITVLRQDSKWVNASSELLPVFVVLLIDALELMSALQQANEREDLSHIHQPSIAPHEQNRDYNDWTVLIDNVRDGWLALLEKDRVAAAAELRRWNGIKYPVFKRLAFFGATHDPTLVEVSELVKWILEDQSYWLWTSQARRETIRLVVSISLSAERGEQAHLQSEIVKGPPVSMFRDDLDQGEIQRAKARMTWMLLAKIRNSGGELTLSAKAAIEKIEADHPTWIAAQDERDEFSIWKSDGDDLRFYDRAPDNLAELKRWLKDKPNPDPMGDSDDWTDLCIKRRSLALAALRGLSEEDSYPIGRWQQALQTWSNEDESFLEVWSVIAPIAIEFRSVEIGLLSRQIAWWLKAAARWVQYNDPYFLQLINRVLDCYETQAVKLDDDVISRAINHPTGISIESLLNNWLKSGLEDDQKIDLTILPTFNRVFQPGSNGLYFCQVILAGSLLTLFRVDQIWTKHNLLPAFSWNASPDRAVAMWKSFLHSPRIYWPLLIAMKQDFLRLPAHFNELGQTYRRQYSSLLTFCALDINRQFTDSEFRCTLAQMPIVDLEEVAFTLFRAMQGSVESKESFFEHRIRSFFVQFWPKSSAFKTQAVSRAFALLSTVSGDAFPAAIALFKDWLQPIDDVNHLITLLNRGDSSRKFPSETLKLLSATINEEAIWITEELKSLLVSIKQVQPELASEQDFLRLTVFLQKCGHDWP